MFDLKIFLPMKGFGIQVLDASPRTISVYWFGIQNGLSRTVNSSTDTDTGDMIFINYYDDPQDSNTLGHNYVSKIFENSNHSIRVGQCFLLILIP